MNNTVVITARHWHHLCHELDLDEYNGADGRKEAFEECFNCVVHWRSGLQEWGGSAETAPEPTMVLRFHNPHDAVIFALKWAV